MVAGGSRGAAGGIRGAAGVAAAEASRGAASESGGHAFFVEFCGTLSDCDCKKTRYNWHSKQTYFLATVHTYKPSRS